ncbi:MAG: CsgG/HfaB family protein [Cyanobacteriota/Melainabacteria group bacterium]|nr:curli production assembly protein CsgG [Cyanobacteria bacterium HKST-UBA01]
MNFRKIGSVIMTLAFVMTTLIYAPPAKADAKRRVAVLPFEYGAVQSYVGTVDVGKGITTLLLTKLVNDGTFSVVERQILDQILKEQNFSVSDRADNSTAIKIGKLLSVDAIVVGTVTHFGFENSSMNVGAGIGAATRYIPYVGGFGGFGGGMRVKKGKAKVAIDARIVDTATGEILAATHGDGVSTRSGASLWGGGADVGFDSSGFASSIAGEATMQAVDAVGSQLIAMANRIPDNKSIAQADVQGKIADVTGDTVIVNLGKQNGLAIGNKLHVERAYKTIRDPDSGKVIKEMFKTVATIALTEVDATSSTGKISDGTGVRVGDVVKKVTATVTGTVLGSDSKGAESTEESASASSTQ